jgi:hypothetical protein
MLKILITSIIVSALLTGTAFAQLPSRSTYNIPPPDIFSHLFYYLDEDNWEKVEGTVTFLSVLIGEMETEFGIKIESALMTAVREKDKEKFEKLALSLVFFDAKSLFAGSQDELARSPDKAITRLKAAYSDYIACSARVEKYDFKLNQKIKTVFRKAYIMVQSEKINEPSYRLALDEIQNAWSVLLPNLKGIIFELAYFIGHPIHRVGYGDPPVGLTGQPLFC